MSQASQAHVYNIVFYRQTVSCMNGSSFSLCKTWNMETSHQVICSVDQYSDTPETGVCLQRVFCKHSMKYSWAGNTNWMLYVD